MLCYVDVLFFTICWGRSGEEIVLFGAVNLY